MKSFLALVVLVGLLAPLAGCETLSDSKQENQVRVETSALLDLRQVNNDIEYVLYLDRPVWLSRYPIPND